MRKTITYLTVATLLLSASSAFATECPLKEGDYNDPSHHFQNTGIKCETDSAGKLTIIAESGSCSGDNRMVFSEPTAPGETKWMGASKFEDCLPGYIKIKDSEHYFSDSGWGSATFNLIHLNSTALVQDYKCVGNCFAFNHVFENPTLESFPELTMHVEIKDNHLLIKVVGMVFTYDWDLVISGDDLLDEGKVVGKLGKDNTFLVQEDGDTLELVTDTSGVLGGRGLYKLMLSGGTLVEFTGYMRRE